MAILEGVPAWELGLTEMIDVRHSPHISNPAGFGKVQNVIGFVVHHSVTAMPANASEAAERQHIQVIDRYHLSLGWGGFGYHACAFPSGRAYMCGDLNSQRAHVKGRNHELIGVVAVGTFTDALPGQPQMSAIQECLNEFRKPYGGLPARGHGQWALPGEGTACPGQLAAVNWDAPAQPPALQPIDFYHAAGDIIHFTRMGFNPKDIAEIDKRAIEDFARRMRMP